MSNYTINSKKELKNSVVEIQGEIPSDIFDASRAQVIADMKKDFEFPGFRKGNVPKDVFLQHADEGYILEKAAGASLKKALPHILTEQKLEMLGMPQVTITKMAQGNPLGFTLQIATIPSIKLPNYKKIAQKTIAKHADKKTEVTDDELNNVINQIQVLRQREPGEAPSEAKEGAKPPEVTDEFVRSIGAFENVADFKNKLKQNIKDEKEHESRRAAREEIAKNLVDETKLSIPEFVIETETREAKERLLEELSSQNTSLPEYLKRTNLTEEQLHKEQRDYIERQLKMRIILEAIAREEKIALDEKSVAAQMDRERFRHPGADPSQLKAYVTRMLLNEKVLELLEGRSPEQREGKK